MRVLSQYSLEKHYSSKKAFEKVKFWVILDAQEDPEKLQAVFDAWSDRCQPDADPVDYPCSECSDDQSEVDDLYVESNKKPANKVVFVKVNVHKESEFLPLRIMGVMSMPDIASSMFRTFNLVPQAGEQILLTVSLRFLDAGCDTLARLHRYNFDSQALAGYRDLQTSHKKLLEVADRLNFVTI